MFETNEEVGFSEDDDISMCLSPDLFQTSQGFFIVWLCHHLGWEDPLKEGMQPTPVFLPGESHGRRSLADNSPWGHKELDMTERLSTQHGSSE